MAIVARNSAAGRKLARRAVRAQRLGQLDAAVLALAVLEQRDDRPPDRDRGAVERVQRRGARRPARACGCPGAGPGSRSCSSTRSARGSGPGWAATPRSRTSWRPSCRGRRRRCSPRGRACSSSPQDLLLDREDPLVLGRRVLGRDEAEHLDLVELVHAEDPRACPCPPRRPRGGSTARSRRSAAAGARRRGSRRRAARQRAPPRCRRGTARPRAGGRSAARCPAGSRSRRAPARARAPAGSPARSRAPRSFSSAQRTSASSSITRSPFR